ncbi:hypothetical protein ALC57_15259 [Trachymyrmex cornetzi]|uniref:Uncharacterized protein n=1 Tax=Trachymyrmex cornetzi TaxID=471704 RepID=A0A195DI70_9HYME|nr:hypothetical protein ALC57_15259 [Trachymyrmex cornetzi]
MWSPSCSTPKCILALTDPPAGNDKYGPLTVLSGLVYIDTVHETVKRRRHRRTLSRRRRGMARHELIRECVRIVEKQCITLDNKQIEAGQKGEREKERERKKEEERKGYIYPMKHHASMRRASNTPLIRVHVSVYGFLQPLLIQFLRGLICSRNAGVRVCMCTVHIELWRGDDSKLSNEIASGTPNC